MGNGAKEKEKKGTKVYKGEEISRKIKKRGREKEEFDDQDRTEADTVRCMKVRGVRGREGGDRDFNFKCDSTDHG